MSYSEWSNLLPPQPDELLSSWLFRNAFFIKLSPYKFCEYVFDAGRLWYQDADRALPEQTLKNISDKAKLPLSTIKKLQLSNDDNDIGHQTAGQWPFILSNGTEHQNRKKYSQLYCPLCLREAPYFRRAWRFGYELYCFKHKIHLRDDCPHCYGNLAPHRSILFNQTKCVHCQFDLTTICHDPSHLIEPELAELQSTFEHLDERFSSPDGENDKCLDFVKTARSLLSFCHYTNLINKIQGFSSFPESEAFKTSRVKTFELSRIPQRTFQLRLLAFMMFEFPTRFLNYCSKFNVSRNFFIKGTDSETLNYLTRHLYLRTYSSRKDKHRILRPPSSCSAKSICNYKNKRAQYIWKLIQ